MKIGYSPGVNLHKIPFFIVAGVCYIRKREIIIINSFCGYKVKRFHMNKKVCVYLIFYNKCAHSVRGGGGGAQRQYQQTNRQRNTRKDPHCHTMQDGYVKAIGFTCYILFCNKEESLCYHVCPPLVPRVYLLKYPIPIGQY